MGEPNFLLIAGILIAFFGFVGSVLLGIVGYFIKVFHTEYKADKLKNEAKEEKTEERIKDVADTFTKKLEGLVDKIGDKINNLPKGSENLSQVMLQFEKEALVREQAMQRRLDEHSQRIQNNYDRIETVAVRYHAMINADEPANLRKQLEERRAKKLAEKAHSP